MNDTPPVSRQRYDPEQKAEMCRLYQQGLTTYQVAEQAGCCQATVWLVLIAAGIVRRQKAILPKLSPRLVGEICAAYEAGASGIELQSTHNLPKRIIYQALRARGIEPRSRSACHRLHSVNESAFDDAGDNPEAAYWVGFLMADGCVMQRKGTSVVVLSLAPKDSGHVERFRSFLGSSHPIRCLAPSGYEGSTGAAYLSIGSARLAEALARYGVVPQKTAREQVSRLAGSRDFWRGVIDGDGSLGFRSSRYGGSPWLSLLAGPALLGQFRAYVKTVAPRWHAEIRPTRGTSEIRVGGRYAAWAVGLLYRGCVIALPRKQERAERMMEWQPRRRERISHK